MVGPENTENKVICIFLWWIVNKMQVFSSQNICLLTPSAKKNPKPCQGSDSLTSPSKTEQLLKLEFS